MQVRELRLQTSETLPTHLHKHNTFQNPTLQPSKFKEDRLILCWLLGKVPLCSWPPWSHLLAASLFLALCVALLPPHPPLTLTSSHFCISGKCLFQYLHPSSFLYSPFLVCHGVIPQLFITSAVFWLVSLLTHLLASFCFLFAYCITSSFLLWLFYC